MNRGKFQILSLFFLLFVGLSQGMAQENDTTSGHHKIMTGGIVVGNDTFPLTYLNPFFKEDYLDPASRARINKLRYDVTKVYPYAVTAAFVLQQVDNELAIRKKKKDRKTYLKEMHNAMKDRFKGELKNLTTTQGQILVKLIYRQTGRDCYDVIKELRGGLNARISQIGASLFHNNLKAQYDPYGADADIEVIVQEIETKNYYYYQTQTLEKRAALNKGQ